MIIKLAWRNIWRSKLRSSIVIISIILGMCAGTFIMGFYKGMLNQRIETVIKDEISHLQFHHPEYEKADIGKIKFSLDKEKEIIAAIEKNSNVKAWSPRVVIHGIMSSAHGMGSVKIKGIDAEKEKALTRLDSKVREGKYFEDDSRRIPVLISEKQAEKYHLKLKSKPVITFTDKNDQQYSLGLKVAGIYKTGNSMLDEVNIYIPREKLSQIAGAEKAHEIAVLLKNNEVLEETVKDFKASFPELSVKSWIEISPTMKMMVDTMDVSLYVIVVIIMLALIFGIINTMLMAVLERTREFGMLMAVGMNKTRIFFLVVTETLLLSLVGGPSGIFAGYLIITYFGNAGIDLGSFGEGLETFGFSTMVYPVLETEKYIAVAIMIFVFTLLASVYPAIKALQLNPVKAIRKD